MAASFPARTQSELVGEPDPLQLPGRSLRDLLDEDDQREGGFSIDVEMHICTPNVKTPARLSRGNFRDYATVSIVVAN